MGGFARDARKAENGFIFVRIVSSHPRERNNSRKMPVISDRSRSRSMWPAKFRRQRGHAPRTGAVMLPPRALHMHFTFFWLKGAANEDWVRSNRGWFGSDPSHRNRDARIIGRIHVRDGHHDGGKSRNAARCGSTDGPRRATTHSRQRRRNGAAIESRLRGRAADVRAADRFASCEAARSSLSERKRVTVNASASLREELAALSGRLRPPVPTA